MLATDRAITDAVLGLAGLVLVGPLVRSLVLATGAAPRTTRALVRRAAAALRPHVMRRLVAGLVGLATPVLATTAPARACTPAVAPDVSPQRDVPTSATSHRDRAATTEHVVVVPGDTLWALARSRLPRNSSDAAVAREWPRWYAANRAVIGPDPNLIRPGMRLRVPDRRPTGTSSPSTTAPARGPSAGATPFDPDRR